mmetsp:Transcript_31118/g.87650  ORF Transcript_31118/g.87650 Transcript_31118/m.87650 type:complete len:209 (+) Transcript_31118:1062-1688(+)
MSESSRLFLTLMNMTSSLSSIVSVVQPAMPQLQQQVRQASMVLVTSWSLFSTFSTAGGGLHSRGNSSWKRLFMNSCGTGTAMFSRLKRACSCLSVVAIISRIFSCFRIWPTCPRVAMRSRSSRTREDTFDRLVHGQPGAMSLCPGMGEMSETTLKQQMQLFCFSTKPSSPYSRLLRMVLQPKHCWISRVASLPSSVSILWVQPQISSM